MGKIIWAPSALKDIDEIAEYIEKDSVDQASLFVARIIKMVDQLEYFLNLGGSFLRLKTKIVVN